jgi:cytochrome b561
MAYGDTASDSYPATSKWLHWLIALCVLTTAPVAIAMVQLSPGALQDGLYSFHKSLGVLILILMLLRLINRLAVGAPPPAPGIEPWQQAVSSLVHTALYVLLLAMPVVGYLANCAYGAPTPFFGLFDVPPAIGKNVDLAMQLFTLHRWAGWLVVALAGMHIGAALFHYVVRRDGVLQRMLPRGMG